MSPSHKLSRRRFLGEASCAAVGSTALFSTLLNLRMASTAAAQSTSASSGDFKALVCVFFAGGIDSYNVLAPRSGLRYDQYRAIRGDIALNATQDENNELLAIQNQDGSWPGFGIHHGMPEIRDLYNEDKLAWVCNVGTLVEPTTVAQIESRSARLPLGLFSHSDQQQQWQTSVLREASSLGWGGKTADLLQSLNDNDRLSMNISLGGSNIWQTGNQSFSYSIGPNGSTGRTRYDGFSGLNRGLTAAVDSQLDLEYKNLFEDTFARESKRSIDSHLEFSEAIGTQIPFTTTFPSSSMGERLRMVARAIAARNELGMRRMTFFIQLGGWDHHDEVLDNMDAMVPQVSQAVGAFNAAMEELGMSESVTLFSASDFARTLTSNGRGSDHAWGGNQFVCGGAVNGGWMYGTYPELYAGAAQDLGRGRMVPTTSVDEYFAELALWFGVSPQDLPTVLPNINNFPGSLGFLSA